RNRISTVWLMLLPQNCPRWIRVIAPVDKIAELCSVPDYCCKLVKPEKELAGQQYDWLHHHYLHIKSEKDELESTSEKLNDKVHYQ
ncbi:hypothetical protein Ancab_038452, partial [Ancistrocladus abbreviatus]